MVEIADAALAQDEHADLARRIADLSPWFHNLDLQGIRTAPGHFLGDYPRIKWQRFAHAIPADLAGRTVLDIGCNAGFYCIELKRRGADRVVGIDSDPLYLAQARLAAEISGVEIELERMSVYDVARLGMRFDLVLFMGVFYHLRHPLLALDLLYEHVVADLLVFQSMQRGSRAVLPVAENYPFSETALFDDPAFPRMAFIERRYADDPTNWWVPNRAAVEAMLRSAGFRVVDHPEEEVFICRRGSIRDEEPRAAYPARGSEA
jgi:tRNA (mo5U34)-methyltransferase